MEASEEMSWGHYAIKVRNKTFVFLAADSETFSLSTKLPSSAGEALKLPFASPTEYGAEAPDRATREHGVRDAPQAAEPEVKTSLRCAAQVVYPQLLEHLS